jgi:hypothetical protein
LTSSCISSCYKARDVNTGQTLWELLIWPNRFIPSVLNANWRFLGSSKNAPYLKSMMCHWDESAGCHM